MALVLLPCDLPTWATVQRHLHQLKQAEKTSDLIDGMQKLHGLCCVGLDPDDDVPNSCRFDGLSCFIDNVMTVAERDRFFNTVLPSIINSALKLKLLKPLNGLHYSLQQQADQVVLDRRFAMALLANAFFSTFPKRTVKTHPTLQDFNFSDFFTHLDSEDQQLKLRCLLQYFDLAATQEPQGQITIARHIIPKWSKQTLEDWLNCTNQLCPLVIRHDGTIDDAEEGTYQICFTSPRIGGDALTGGFNQEELMLFKNPELLVTLLYVESLDDNETLSAHNWMRVGHLNENSRFNYLVKCRNYYDTHFCAMDAMNFSKCPVQQYEETPLLRELSKAYLGFQQRKSLTRLSPIGESCSSTPPEKPLSFADMIDCQVPKQCTYTHAKVTSQRADIIKPYELKDDAQNNDTLTPSGKCLNDRPATVGSSKVNGQVENGTQKKGVDSAKLSEKLSLLTLPMPLPKLHRRDHSGNSEEQYFNALSNQSSFSSAVEDELWFTPMEPPQSPSTSGFRPLYFNAENPRSDSETISSPHLATKTYKGSRSARSKSDDYEGSDDEDYQSCVEEMDDEEGKSKKLSGPDLISSSGRYLFAESVRGAMRNTSQQSDVEDSSYSLDIQIEGPDVCDPDRIRIKRVPSTGFLLDEDEFFGESLEAEQTWLRQFRNRSTSRSISRRNSSRYSFSSDFSSDLGDIYEHFEDMMAAEPISQDPAVAQYVGGLLKRTLSDSYTTTVNRRSTITGSEVSMPRSLSLADHLTQERLALEKAKQQQTLSSSSPIQKNLSLDNGDRTPDASIPSRRLSGQLDLPLYPNGYRAIATGNWGCGRLGGDAQLKSIIQWLAASRCGIPCLIYFTAGDNQVVKLNTVGRILVDRQWTVGTLTKTVVDYCRTTTRSGNDDSSQTLFDRILLKETN